MIITLTGADFSSNNIGILNGYSINMSLIGVSCDSTAITIGAGKTYSVIFTVNDGYTYNSSAVLMGGEDITSNLIWNEDLTSGTLSIDSVTGDIEINITAFEFVELTSDNATVASTTAIVNTSQSPGSEVSYNSSAGTKGIYTWDIPANAQVTLTVNGGGTYGMALTDSNNIVLEHINNSSLSTTAGVHGTHEFGIKTVPTKLHVSSTKFISASYVVYPKEYIQNLEQTILFESTITGSYISTSQTVGSPVSLSTLSSGSYMISYTIPANTVVTITCTETSTGNYGMALCDISGNVLESFNHKDTAGTDNMYTFAAQEIETKLYVSKNKFGSAIYKLV